jgi:hypothetical protein
MIVASHIVREDPRPNFKERSPRKSVRIDHPYVGSQVKGEPNLLRLRQNVAPEAWREEPLDAPTA